jgi:SAM-dependent methyltransferase
MSGVLHRLHRTGRRAREILSSRLKGGAPCGTCGFAGQLLHRDALWPALINEWELDANWAHWMNQREGSRCAWCGSSLRSGQLAASIVATVNGLTGSVATCLSELFRDPKARALKIAEINSAGNLHRYLARCLGLCHSEFGSVAAAVPSEDLMNLSYADATFNLVVTSDTLEHVPDIDRALRETYRVLMVGGSHVFSVPVVWDRLTRRRALLHDGVLEHLLPPSYHGAPAEGKPDFLVFHEFGSDLVERCAEVGFDLRLMRHASNPAVVTFMARRPA